MGIILLRGRHWVGVEGKREKKKEACEEQKKNTESCEGLLFMLVIKTNTKKKAFN